MSSKNQDNKMYLKLAELQSAFYEGLDEQYIEKLLQNDFDINYRPPSDLIGIEKLNGMTALHLAEHEKRIDVSKLLLRYGADFTMKNSTGSTALHVALERAYQHQHEKFQLREDTSDFFNLILSAHIQSRNFKNPCNENGISHFHAACTVKNEEAVRFFLDNGISVDQVIDVNSPILPGYTALHIAVQYFNLDAVCVLLEHSADVNAKNSEGMTPVHVCVKQIIEKIYRFYDVDESESETLYSILLLLFEKYNVIDDVGLSHLHISCILGDSSIVKRLLEQHAIIDHSLSANSPIYAGYTALHFAIESNIEIVRLLVANGANMQLKNSDGYTPLDFCLRRYNITEVHSIISCHPVWKNVLLVDNKTKLLDLICSFRKLDQFKSFIQNNNLDLKKPLLPANSPLWPGYTVLHLAIALFNNEDDHTCNAIIDVCLEKDADAMTQDTFGSTPFHLAVQKKMLIYWSTFLKLWKSCKNIENIVNNDNFSHLHILCSNRYNIFHTYGCKIPDLIEELLLKDAKDKKQSHISYKGQTFEGIVSGSTPLHLAVTDIEKTKTLMEHGADIYAVDAEGFTPIHRLIKKDDYVFKGVAAILFSTPDLKDHVVSNIGLSHLHVAAHLDDVESLEKLLDCGADINSRISPKLTTEISFLEKYAGFTALHIAVKRNNKNTVDFLVQRGADIFAENTHGLPLIYEILNSSQGEHSAAFADVLENDSALQRRFNEETGLTMFHIACHKLDVNLMKHYLSGTNINARACNDSPIWPWFTALHILGDRMRLHRLSVKSNNRFRNIQSFDNLVDSVLEFLLQNEADITLANNNKKTLLHLLFQEMASGLEKSCFRVSSALKAQNDFSLNPTDSEGMSHFHIACAMNDCTAVQQFLKHGVDVNKPNNRGDNPLHLSAGSSGVEFTGSAPQLKTIQLLLKHGAKINVKNNIGHTPLHEAAVRASSPIFSEVFEELFKAGADPNVESASRRTPLELLCRSETSSVDNFKLFNKRGCHLNAFTRINNEGFIGLILNSRNPNRDSIWSLILSLPEARTTDRMGCSVIDNVVSLKNSTVRIDNYYQIINDLVDIGCDVDAQNEKGETALHKAAEFRNEAAVSSLIEAGADFNIEDENGETALACTLEPFLGSEYDTMDTHGTSISKMLLRQVLISLYFDLYICEINEYIKTEAMKILEFWSIPLDKKLFDEIREIDDTKIGESMTLRRFLSEKTISAYPYTSPTERSAIQAFVNSIDESKFQVLKPVIKMLFRKAEKRINLVVDAAYSLQILSDIPVPEVCSRIILENLRNADLENLIAAAAFENT